MKLALKDIIVIKKTEKVVKVNQRTLPLPRQIKRRKESKSKKSNFDDDLNSIFIYFT
jgi:hypothetical protein